VDDLRRAVPVLESLPGWQCDITHAREVADLPPKAQSYLHRINQLVGCPVEFISVGPDREQTIFASRAGIVAAAR
jgi:adenylosuccinate synthase